ncbi:MAG: 2-polyprenylphenol 6-hydroxylase [Devosia sp.]
MGLAAYFRLARAGFVLAREGALSILDNPALPPVMRTGIKLGRLIERPSVRETGRVERLTNALNRLGPTYVKFGQTLATRPDIVGAAVAADLAVLQDKMEPFDAALVPGLLQAALGSRAADLVDLSPPIAAASIAQVHRATLVEADGTRRPVAVKLLRPGVRERFAADLESFRAGARLAELFVPSIRRLRPIDVAETLERSAWLELDLRLEAASMSEFSDNLAADGDFRIPSPSWDHTSDSVLTTGWVDGIPIANHAALDAAGIDRKALAKKVLASFLQHAIRDGFFHADMHPGNLFADPLTGGVVAVDFGIMGRISRVERRFLADILYGFITRNYRMIAERHFEIGYVPSTQSVDEFALALRAIGEPLQGRRASDISMARVLGQLFSTTELFNMQTRPELVLLQKSMVLVEGVARALDPDLDIWAISEPVVGEWLKREAGPMGRIEAAAAEGKAAFDALRRVPALVLGAERLILEHEADRLRKARQRAALSAWTGPLIVIAVIVGLLVLVF